MAKDKTRSYGEKLDRLNAIRARPDKPSRTKRKLEADTSAEGVEVERQETRRPKISKDKKPRGSR